MPTRWDRGQAGWQLPFVDAGITWFFSKYLEPGSRILDVGCGTGIDYVARLGGDVRGIDLAPTRLRKAREIYSEVSIAGVTKIPYPDNAFDAVISVDVLEHIPAAVKDDALREMMRVVRPGGRLVHILDLDSQKPLHLWARRFPDLFEKYFIEQMGHYGLETASAALARFRSLGLEILAAEPTNRTSLQLLENYAWQFDNEYRFKSTWVRLLTSGSWFLRRHRLLNAAYAGFYQLAWTRSVEKIFPVDWSFNLAIACVVRK